MSTSNIVTRFAPSPTGYLHVGGARTALFNWLLARHTGGKFLLRIEDTDLARSTNEATRQLLEDLKWLGLNWDNSELVFQSKRLSIYNALIDDLLTRGLAYEAWESGEELDSMRKQAERARRPFIYRRQNYTADQIQRFKSENRKSYIRFVMPVKEYRFRDEVLDKEVVQPAAESQDFVIRKTDGMPTYHFGVVVDDADMGITHVLRGLEHLKNTFSHIALQEALGYARPTYAHLSVMLNPETGEKLSKRDRDRKIRDKANAWMRNTKKTAEDLAKLAVLPVERVAAWLPPKVNNDSNPLQLDLHEQAAVMPVVGLSDADLPEIMIHDFRRNGYAPELLLNFLALQGWSPGGDREHMSMPEMTDLFGIDRIIASNPKFNREKLKSFSTTFFAKASPERLLSCLRDYLSVNPASSLNKATDVELAKALKINAGFHILREMDDKSRFLFVPDDQLSYDPDAVEKVLKKNELQGANALREILPELKALDAWDVARMEHLVKDFCEKRQLGLGKVAQPIRVAVSGSTVSPPIFDTMEFLGKDRTLARIERCLSLLS